MTYGRIKSIETVEDFKIERIAPLHGESGARLGFGQMINALAGYQGMEGYKVETDKHAFYVLIDSQQSCCESFGYIASDDEIDKFVGAKLLSVKLTDTSLMKEGVEELQYLDEGGVQFVDFETSAGKLQLAVYNGHNGYYGHGILVAKDDEILLNGTI